MEAQILLFLQENVRNYILDPIMLGITHSNDGGIICIGVILILLLIKKTRRVGIYCTIALFLNLLLINGILKNIVGRIRPYEVIEGLICMIGPQHDESFPSGHTSSAFVIAGIIFLKLPKKVGIPALIVASVIAFSRLYVGVHYPTDVLAGMLLGLLLAVLTVYLLDKAFARYDAKKANESKEMDS